jgi:3-isopropylmalate/(R)-2-methylmalate dehydratase small subunit
MQPFRRHAGRAALLPRANVDTDQIVPKQFLKRVERSGFGAFLFHDWRFLADGTPNPAFELNRPEATGASILVAGANFGCGSSREHAPWALADYGFRAIVAPSFADIFFGNCCQNGLVPVVLPPEDVARLLAFVPRPLDLVVDLERGTVEGPDGFRAAFTLDAYRREMLLEGLDEIGRTLKLEPKITAWERRRAAEVGA